MMIFRKTLTFDAARTIAQFSSISRRLTVAQDQASTGLAVRRPSDAPAAWAQIHGITSALADHENWAAGMDRATEVFEAADTALDEAENIVSRAIERAIQAASESLPTVDRTAMAPEIGGMREDVLRLANTRISDRYVFAGDAYQAAGFDPTGAYVGATASTAVLIAENTDVQLAIDGSDVFAGAGDVFQLMSDFEAALAADDTATIQSMIPQLDAARQQLVAARQEIGFRQARVDDMEQINESMSLVLTNRYTGLVDADPAAAYTELVTLQTSYQAAMQVAATSSGAKLFDYLR